MKTKSRLKFESGAQGPLSPLPPCLPPLPPHARRRLQRDALAPVGVVGRQSVEALQRSAADVGGQRALPERAARRPRTAAQDRGTTLRVGSGSLPAATDQLQPRQRRDRTRAAQVPGRKRLCAEGSAAGGRGGGRHPPADVDLQTAGVSDEDRTRAPRQPPSDDGVGHA